MVMMIVSLNDYSPCNRLCSKHTLLVYFSHQPQEVVTVCSTILHVKKLRAYCYEVTCPRATVKDRSWDLNPGSLLRVYALNLYVIILTHYLKQRGGLVSNIRNAPPIFFSY